MDPKLFAKTLIRNATWSRSYYTNRNNKVTLYSKISPVGSPSLSVVPELDNWVHKGKKVRVGELHRIIHDLRKRKRYTHALEVQFFTFYCFSLSMALVWVCVCLLGKCGKRNGNEWLLLLKKSTLLNLEVYCR